MHKLERQEGFSLVEVLVALAVLSIVIVAFTALFTNSFSGIFTAGRKSVELYKAQTDIDDVIAKGAFSNAHTLEIDFGGQKITIHGQEAEIHYVYEDRSGTLFYFLPE